MYGLYRILGGPKRKLRSYVAYASTTTILSQVYNSEEYLRHCKAKEASLNSTVFKGTLYEFTSKDFLETKLKCFDLIRKGGSFDNGIDLVGKWDLYHFFKLNEKGIKGKKIARTSATEKIIPIINNSKELHELRNTKSKKDAISMRNDINVLVQCKNHNTKIKASILRELVGIYLQHIRTEIDTNSTFMILVSPCPLTKQAQSIIDQTSIPLIHIILSPMAPSSKRKNMDLYNLSNWSGGNIESIYLNNYSKILLKYLNIELELQKLKLMIILD